MSSISGAEAEFFGCTGVRASRGAWLPVTTGRRVCVSDGTEGVPPGRPRPRKSDRAGFPALFLGNGAATAMLVEIACRGPVAVNDLSESGRTSLVNVHTTVRRLVAQGLVRRYLQAPGPGASPYDKPRHVAALDDRGDVAAAVRAVLVAIAGSNGMAVAGGTPSEHLAAVDDGALASTMLFGSSTGGAATMFGSRNRSLVVVLLAALGEADTSSLARAVDVNPDSDMLKLFGALRRDGVTTSYRKGPLRLCFLAEKPWTAALVDLCSALRDREPHLSSLATAAYHDHTNGEHSSRKWLRQQLGLPRTHGGRRD